MSRRVVTVQLTEAELGEIGIALLVMMYSETTVPEVRQNIEKLMNKLGNIAIEDMRKKYNIK